MAGVQAQEHNKDKDHKKMEIKEKDVPEAVRSAFQSQFANASDVDWKMMKGKYKAKFEMGDVDHMAEFTSTGELVSKGMEIDKNEVPTLVSDAVKTGYAGKNIDEVYRVEKGGSTYYMVKLDGDPDKKLMYDAQGKLVKEKMAK